MKRRSNSGGGGSWMDTYGDMVTLLLCFFVMLYAMSTIDAEKWAKIAQSLSGKSTAPVIVDDPEITEDTPNTNYPAITGDTQDPSGGIVYPPDDTQSVSSSGEGVDTTVEDIYNKISEYIGKSGLSASVLMFRGEDYSFIQFRDNIFFAGNSYELLSTALPLLNFIAESIADYQDVIQEVRFYGHTTQIYPDTPNPNVDFDRRLSSERADSVLIYIQKYLEEKMNVFMGKRFTSIGKGSHFLPSPIKSINDEESRIKNRRVEILISLSDNVSSDLNKIYEELGISVH